MPASSGERDHDTRAARGDPQETMETNTRVRNATGNTRGHGLQRQSNARSHEAKLSRRRRATRAPPFSSPEGDPRRGSIYLMHGLTKPSSADVGGPRAHRHSHPPRGTHAGGPVI